MFKIIFNAIGLLAWGYLAYVKWPIEMVLIGSVGTLIYLIHAMIKYEKGE